jgi:hypothetical protein
MDALNAKYGRLMAEYEHHVNEAMVSGNIQPHIAAIKALNQEISSVLDQMIAITAKAKESHATVYRDELMQRLDRIQKDYNGLAQSTDQLETLRRIRRDQGTTANQFFWTYFLLFMVLCAGVLLFLFFGGSSQTVQRSETVIKTPSTAAAIPVLT